MSSPVLDTGVSARVPGLRRTGATHALEGSFALGLLLLVPVVLLLHGYHPFADDAGGIYVAGIEKMLHPELFQSDAAFVVAYTKYSVFSHVFAWVLRLTHLHLEIGLFIAYLASIFLFLLGCLRIAQRAFTDVTARWGAMALAGALFTIPVAATALWMMDPYVTARSFSTPFSLFALAACMDRRWTLTALWVLLTAALHPLMAAYLAAFLVLYVLVSFGQWKWVATVCGAAFILVGALYFATRHDALPYGYREAVLTRDYFFLSKWEWFQWLGLIAPLALMLIAAFRSETGSAVRNLCATCVAAGSTALLSAICFVRIDGSYFLARLQFLRTFQLIYVVGVVLLGGYALCVLAERHLSFAALALVVAAALMVVFQWQSYAASAHVEWPFAAPRNMWQQAFLWVRYNTPKDAVFALDSSYTESAGEDTQSFRTIARRSALVDGLKDGGVAAMIPSLAPRWKQERDLEARLNEVTDAERLRRFKNTPVNWLILSATSTTALTCPYENAAVKVCHLR